MKFYDKIKRAFGYTAGEQVDPFDLFIDCILILTGCLLVLLIIPYYMVWSYFYPKNKITLGNANCENYSTK